MSEVILSLGRKGLEVLSFLREVWRLLVGFLYWLLIAPFRGFKLRFGEMSRQMVRVGVNSIPIVFLVNFFLGVTLAITVADILGTFAPTCSISFSPPRQRETASVWHRSREPSRCTADA